jgi:hypothetical protein
MMIDDDDEEEILEKCMLLRILKSVIGVKQISQPFSVPNLAAFGCSAPMLILTGKSFFPSSRHCSQKMRCQHL